MISRVFVINLPRAVERHERIRSDVLRAGFTADEVELFPAVDGSALSNEELVCRGVSLFPDWKQTSSAVSYHAREIKWGEVGCALSHLAVWKEIAKAGHPVSLILEDDVVFREGARALVMQALSQLAQARPEWDLCYVGRKRMGPPFAPADGEERRVAANVVVPQFSYCTHAYAVSLNGARKLIEARLDRALIPVDEFLPALYCRHPRADVRAVFGEGDRLNAFSVDPTVAMQTGEPSHIESSASIGSSGAAQDEAVNPRSALVVRMLKGESVELLAREANVSAAQLAEWKTAFLRGGEAAVTTVVRAALPSLATVLNADPRAFTEQYWPLRWTVARGDIARFEFPPSLFELERLVRAPGVGLSLFGKAGFRASLATPDDALNFFKNGDTLYIIGLERAFPEVRDLCRALARDLGVESAHVSVEGFASPAGAGSSMHYDFDVNFNVQLKGRKEWKLAANPDVKNPMRSFAVRAGVQPLSPYDGRLLPTQMPPDSETYEVGPGDVVFLPRAAWHETRVLSDSLAIAFVIKPPTYMSLFMGELGNRLRMDPKWRAYPFEANRAEILNDLLRSLPQLLTTFHAEELMFNVVRVRWGTGAKATLEQLDEPRNGARWCLTVTRPEQDLEFPVEDRLVPVVTWMVKQTEPFTTEAMVAECPGSSPAMARRVVSYLVGVGALERLAVR